MLIGCDYIYYNITKYFYLQSIEHFTIYIYIYFVELIVIVNTALSNYFVISIGIRRALETVYKYMYCYFSLLNINIIESVSCL